VKSIQNLAEVLRQTWFRWSRLLNSRFLCTRWSCCGV